MLNRLQGWWWNFYEDPHNQRFIHIFLIALLLRIVLMPFSGHIDVLSEARRVFYWSENNIFFDNIARNTTMFLEVIFYKMTSFLLPDEISMFYLDDIRGSTSSIPHSFEFVSHSTIFRTLFILKLPFLFCDMLTAVVLYHFFDDKQSSLNSCKLWLFNPITLFSFYIFGRFEAIPLLFIAASLLALKKKRIILAALLLGLCLNGREMMIIFGPIFILAVLFISESSIGWIRKITSAAIAFAFLAIALQLYIYFLPDVVNVIGGKAGSVMHEGRVRYLFDFSIQGISMIPFVYAFILIYLTSSDSPVHLKVLLGCSLAMMSFFAFSSHTAHFTAWMIVFPAIYYGYERKFLMPFACLCVAWFVYWTILTDMGVFTLWLGSAYSLHFIGIPNVPMYLEEFATDLGIFNRTMLIHLCRTVWVATLFYLGFMMIKTTHSLGHEKK